MARNDSVTSNGCETKIHADCSFRLVSYRHTLTNWGTTLMCWVLRRGEMTPTRCCKNCCALSTELATEKSRVQVVEGHSACFYTLVCVSVVGFGSGVKTGNVTAVYERSVVCRPLYWTQHRLNTTKCRRVLRPSGYQSVIVKAPSPCDVWINK